MLIVEEVIHRNAVASASPSSVVSSAISGCTRVAFMPFNRENQYWAQLAKHLADYGVAVEERGMLKGLLPKIIRRESMYDLLHMHWMPCFGWSAAGLRRLPSFWLHMLFLWLLGHRVVWTAHDLAHPETVWRFADRLQTILVTPFISRIIVHTETAREIVCREFWIWRKSKVVVIPHGNYIGSYPNTVSRREARSILGLNLTATTFVLLGHIRPYKGVNALIEAFQELGDAESQLMIVGKPMDERTVPELDRLIKNGNRVRILPGFVPDERIQLYVNAADVMVIPYRQGLTSGAAVLAMSFGRAVVAANLGCMPDMIPPEGGFLYDPSQPGALRVALGKALAAKDSLDDMGQHNLERAKAWDWDRVARMTYEVYASILGRGNRQSPN